MDLGQKFKLFFAAWIWKIVHIAYYVVCFKYLSLVPFFLGFTEYFLFPSNAVAGESALDRIACGLGGKIVLPMIKQHIMQMLQNCKFTKTCVQEWTDGTLLILLI